jgi:hypothetical protein
VKGGLLVFHDYRHPMYLPATEFLDSLPEESVAPEGTGLVYFKK